MATITEKDEFDPNNLPVPTRDGYEFQGWFVDKECKTSISGNLPKKLVFTLYAKWRPTDQDYKVEYYLEKLDGGFELEETLSLKAAR